ncbi:MAG TPA: 4'-phosphopantetheinyl transferase superfamily protein [Verrucomicrobiae bacterium]|nr:4'-phosphopantetheinyl transferase superfamily protein [Verrucomicrobiae bacterium]
MSDDEIQRAGRFHFEQHRNRFIAGRGLLRAVLARYLCAAPKQIKFAYGTNGKPCLAKSTGGDNLEFNLAHSEDVALLAVTRTFPVGIDVERIRPMPDAAELVARFFSPRESAIFRGLPSEEQSSAFFSLWTRKEALLKATGEGIGHLLNQVEVSFLPGEPVRIIRMPEGFQRSLQHALQAEAAKNSPSLLRMGMACPSPLQKGRGPGRGVPLHVVHPTVPSITPPGPQDRTAPSLFLSAWKATAPWTLCNLAPASGFAAALAVADPDPCVKTWQWSFEETGKRLTNT